MRFFIILLLPLIISSCNTDEPYPDPYYLNTCSSTSEILPPGGYEITELGQIDAEVYVRKFQFLSDNLGYAMSRKVFGGHFSFFRTEDGGTNWNKIHSGKFYQLLDMTFFDENTGVIALDNRSGNAASS